MFTDVNGRGAQIDSATNPTGPWQQREMTRGRQYSRRQLRGGCRMPARRGAIAIHHDGNVPTAAGEWWGVPMMHANSVGHLLTLAPITWRDGWPENA